MKSFSLEEIARILKGRVCGDPALKIKGVMPLEEARTGDISVVFNEKAASGIAESRASAFVLPEGKDWTAEPVVEVAHPKQAFVQLIHLFYPQPEKMPGIDARAVVSPGAQCGAGISIGPGAVIEDQVMLSDHCRIHANVFIGKGSFIGAHTEIFPNVTIYSGTRIGDRVRIHAGTVIGSDGFGYMPDESGEMEKIPQVGIVEIENDVEIGANCTIDRATLGTTLIRCGSKIDNQVQIAHNCRIGQHCIIVAQTGISGSVRMGDHCVLAGQVGIGDHVELQSGTIVGAQSGVVSDIGPGRWLGYPAIPVVKALRAYHILPELPEIRRKVRELESRLTELEGKI